MASGSDSVRSTSGRSRFSKALPRIPSLLSLHRGSAFSSGKPTARPGPKGLPEPPYRDELPLPPPPPPPPPPPAPAPAPLSQPRRSLFSRAQSAVSSPTAVNSFDSLPLPPLPVADLDRQQQSGYQSVHARAAPTTLSFEPQHQQSQPRPLTSPLSVMPSPTQTVTRSGSQPSPVDSAASISSTYSASSADSSSKRSAETAGTSGTSGTAGSDSSLPAPIRNAIPRKEAVPPAVPAKDPGRGRGVGTALLDMAPSVLPAADTLTVRMAESPRLAPAQTTIAPSSPLSSQLYSSAARPALSPRHPLPPVPVPDRRPVTAAADTTIATPSTPTTPHSVSTALPDSANLWRRRSLKIDVPRLQIPQSHGSTAETAQLDGVGSASLAQPSSSASQLGAAALSPSSQTQHAKGPPAGLPLSGSRPGLGAVGAKNSSLPGRNIRPLASVSAPKKANGSPGPGDDMAPNKLSSLKNKLLGRKSEQQRTDNGRAEATSGGPDPAAAETTTAAAATPTQRPPTPAYELGDVQTSTVETTRSPVSPATSPELPKATVGDAISPISMLQSPSADTVPEQLQTGPDRAVHRADDVSPQTDLHAMRSMPDLSTGNGPSQHQQQQQQQQQQKHPQQQHQKQHPAPLTTSGSAPAPSFGRPSGPKSPLTYGPPASGLDSILPPPNPPFARGQNMRRPGTAGSMGGGPGPAQGRFPIRGPHHGYGGGGGGQFPSQPPLPRGPLRLRHGDYIDDVDPPVVQNPANPWPEVVFRETGGAAPAPDPDSDPPIPFDDVAAREIQPARPLGQAHRSCFLGHAGMRLVQNQHNPMACQTCLAEDTEVRWYCHWCNLRICGPCRDVFEGCGRQLTALQEHLERQPHPPRQPQQPQQQPQQQQQQHQGGSPGLSAVPE